MYYSYQLISIIILTGISFFYTAPVNAKTAVYFEDSIFDRLKYHTNKKFEQILFVDGVSKPLSQFRSEYLSCLNKKGSKLKRGEYETETEFSKRQKGHNEMNCEAFRRVDNVQMRKPLLLRYDADSETFKLENIINGFIAVENQDGQEYYEEGYVHLYFNKLVGDIEWPLFWNTLPSRGWKESGYVEEYGTIPGQNLDGKGGTVELRYTCAQKYSASWERHGFYEYRRTGKFFIQKGRTFLDKWERSKSPKSGLCVADINAKYPISEARQLKATEASLIFIANGKLLHSKDGKITKIFIESIEAENEVNGERLFQINKNNILLDSEVKKQNKRNHLFGEKFF